MTLGSLQARLLKVNPSLRFRKRAPMMGVDGPLTLVGVYRRLEYMTFCLDGNDVTYTSKPIYYKKVKNIINGGEFVQVKSGRRRGRDNFVRLLRGHRLIKRSGAQFLLL